MTDRNKVLEIQERLQENLISNPALLDFLLYKYLSGSEALQAMQAALVEFGLEDEEDEDEFDNEDEFEKEAREIDSIEQQLK